MVPFRRFLHWLLQTSKAAYHWLAGPVDTPRAATDAKGAVEPELSLGTNEPPRYAKRRSLLTDAESELFSQLLNEIGAEYRVFTKVRLGDVMYLQNLTKDRKYHHQIQCKHFDFVVCHSRSQEPMLAIELNDASHSRYSRMQSDQFKRKVCAEIGLPMLWLNVGVRYPPGDLARQIRDKLSPGAPPMPTLPHGPPLST